MAITTPMLLDIYKVLKPPKQNKVVTQNMDPLLRHLVSKPLHLNAQRRYQVTRICFLLTAKFAYNNSDNQNRQ